MSKHIVLIILIVYNYILSTLLYINLLSRGIVLGVSAVLRSGLSVDAPTFRIVVDRGGDNIIESFVIHLLSVGIVGLPLLLGDSLY